MEKIRKSYIDNILLEISRLEKTITRDEDILQNLKNVNIPVDIYNKKRDEIKSNIEKKRLVIEEYKKRQNDYLTGKLDEEIQKELAQNKINITINNKKKQQQPHKKPIKKLFKNNIQSEQSLNHSIDNSYNQFLKAINTLSHYTNDNLYDMPNNKGYIWRGCWFFGYKKPEYGQPDVMFEKLRNGVMHIHEISEYEHKIFEKIGNAKKQLISNINRQKKSHTK